MSVHHFPPRNAPEITDGGGPPYDGAMEARISVLESRLDTVLPTLATKADVAGLRSEISGGNSDMIKWIVGTAVGGIAVFVTVMTFVLNNAVPKVANQAPQQPVIINVQPATAPSK